MHCSFKSRCKPLQPGFRVAVLRIVEVLLWPLQHLLQSFPGEEFTMRRGITSHSIRMRDTVSSSLFMHGHEKKRWRLVAGFSYIYSADIKRISLSWFALTLTEAMVHNCLLQTACSFDIYHQITVINGDLCEKGCRTREEQEARARLSARCHSNQSGRMEHSV